MPNEINWERTTYVSRIDLAADNISEFVDAVLATIDVDAARASPARWKVVCGFFAGCAGAARAQGNTPGGGGKRIAAYLTAAFPCTPDTSPDGFFEFMDWLSDPAAFRPAGLRWALGTVTLRRK